MITLTDVLTNRTWRLPDNLGGIGTWPEISGNLIFMGQFPPGRYDIKNGSGNPLVVLANIGSEKALATIPNGATWNIATQENDRSMQPYCLDYAVWHHSGRFN